MSSFKNKGRTGNFLQKYLESANIMLEKKNYGLPIEPEVLSYR